MMSTRDPVVCAHSNPCLKERPIASLHADPSSLLSVACVALGCEAGDGGTSALSGGAPGGSSAATPHRSVGDARTVAPSPPALTTRFRSTPLAPQISAPSAQRRGIRCGPPSARRPLHLGRNQRGLSGTSQCEAVIEACEQSGGVTQTSSSTLKRAAGASVLT